MNGATYFRMRWRHYEKFLIIPDQADSHVALFSAVESAVSESDEAKGYSLKRVCLFDL